MQRRNGLWTVQSSKKRDEQINAAIATKRSVSTAKGDPNLCILHETKLRQHRNRFQEHTEGPEDLTKVTKSCERVDYQGKDNTRHHLQQGLKKIKLMQRQTNNRDIISRNQGFIN